MTVLPPTTLRETRVIDGLPSLRCSKCRTWKPTDQFSPNKFTRSGYQSWCRCCQKEANAIQSAKRRAKIAQKQAVLKSFSQTVPMSRKPVKTQQKPSVRKRKAIKPVSDKRKVQNAEYSKLRLDFLEQHPLCQVCLSEEANQIHHTFHREGKRLNDQNYWLAVGPDCHRQIHDQPSWAKEKGYLL